MIQLQMIDRVKSIALDDKLIASVLMYGSFIKDEGDKYSDIEFYIFFTEDFDHQKWVHRISKTILYFTNEHGTEVAIFDNLIRGEFHFHHVDERKMIQTWEGLTSFEYHQNMILVDKDCVLAKLIEPISKERPQHSSQESIDWISMSLVNQLLMTQGLLKRGELAHAQMSFQTIQKYLLWLIRTEVGDERHWESPTKRAELEIPKNWYNEYAKCTPSLNQKSLLECFDHTLYVLNNCFERITISTDVKSLLTRINN